MLISRRINRCVNIILKLCSCHHIQIEGSDHPALITEHNDLGSQRFYDARSKQSFKYDHLRKEAQDYEPYEPDPIAEPWRSALQEEITNYTQSHYRHGGCSVFGKSLGGNCYFDRLTV